MTLIEHVAEVIDDPDIRDEEWFPTGWIVRKGGPVHVEDAANEEEVVSLCGVPLSDGYKHMGPARGLLRRADGCKNCERALDD